MYYNFVYRELKHQTFLTTRTAEMPRKTGSRPSFLARNWKVKQSTFSIHELLPVLACLCSKMQEI